MCRLLLIASFLLVAPASVRAAELPVGKRSVAEPAAKGNGHQGNRPRRQGNRHAIRQTGGGTWDGETLKLKGGRGNLEACLVVEETAKGETKYTLTGFRWTQQFSFFVAPPLPNEWTVRRGWYAQKVVKPADEIKVEIKGTIVCKDTTSAYVLVKRPDGFGREQETRVYFWLSEGEWKYWRDVLPKLNGQAVTVTGALGQIPKDTKTSIPEGAMYFQRGFVIKTATETFK